VQKAKINLKKLILSLISINYKLIQSLQTEANAFQKPIGLTIIVDICVIF
jgi:hypothetical protein